jgi:hypothetical protein
MADFILHDNLFGVDLSPEAVEITQLSLWLRSASRGRTLMDLSKNIVCGNSLVADPEVDPRAMAWETTFPRVYERGTRLDCVIGNPPWERFSLKNREFLMRRPAVLEAPTAAESRRKIAELETRNPALYQRYVEARDRADKTMTYIRQCGRFPLTGKDRTRMPSSPTWPVCRALNGRVSLLVHRESQPTIQPKFLHYLVERIASVPRFRKPQEDLPDIHRTYKFCVLLFGSAGNREGGFRVLSYRIRP